MFRQFPPYFLGLVAIFILIAARSGPAQTRCLTADEIKQFTDRVSGNTTRPFNKQLSDELNKLAARQQQRVENNVADNKSADTILETLRTSREQNTGELCSMVKQYGWPTRDLVGDEGARSAFFLLRNSASADLQRDLLPVIIAAVKKGEVPRSSFAAYIDRLRVNAGLKQIFGTQATILNGLLVLFPITDEPHVDARRKQFELPPLNEYLRGVERMYRLRLI